MKIQIIFGSTREGRRGEVVAKWVTELAKQRKDPSTSSGQSFEVEFIDLKEWNLPMFNDPKNPSGGEYSYDYTKKWSDKISEADGYILVTPEYNHGYPAALKNALDLLYKEWNNKPVAFVSYGGSSGGARAVEQLRQVVEELEMVSVHQAIHLVRFPKLFDDQGDMQDPYYADAAQRLFDQLIWWAEILKQTKANS